MTKTFFGPDSIELALAIAISSATFLAHPSGCAVIQTNPLILGSIIIKYFLRASYALCVKPYLAKRIYI